MGGAGGGGASAIRAGRAFVEIYAHDKQFLGTLDGLRSKIFKFGTWLATAGFGGALLGSAVLAPLALLAKHALHVGGAAQDMADRLGASVEEITALGYAAELAGGSLEDVEANINKMQRAIAEGKVVGGLNLGTLLNEDLPTQVDRIADAIAGIENASLRAAAAQDIFGKSGRKMLPFLSEGAAGMARFRLEAAQAIGLTSAEASRLDRVGDAISRVWMAVKSVFRTIGGALLGDAGAAEEYARHIVAVIAGVREWIAANSELIQTLGLVAAGLTALGVAFGTLGAAVVAVNVLVGILTASFTALFAAKAFAISGALAAFAGLIAVMVRFSDVAQVGAQALGGIANALKSGDIQLAGRIAFKGLEYEFLNALAGMTEGWQRFIGIIAGAFGGAKLGRLGGPWGALFGGILGAGAAGVAQEIAGQQARAAATRAKAEFDAMINQAEAQARAKAKNIAKDAKAAAVQSGIIGGPTKGGFGTLQQLRQQTAFGDSVKIAENTAKTAKATEKTVAILENLPPMVWAT